MTSEQDFCTIIVNSIKETGGRAYKIPDPSSAFAIATKRPFDIFGMQSSGPPLYIEAKFMKTLSSFNLQTIEDHQMENLLDLKKLNPEAECWIMLGIGIPRKNRVYLFRNIHEIDRRRKLRENFKAKELESTPYYPVRRGLIDFSELITDGTPN